MAALSESRLRQIIDRFEQIEARMGVATDSKEIVQLSRDHSELRPVVEKAREVMSLRTQLAEADALIGDQEADREFVNMAIEERAEIKGRLPDIEREMQLMLLPKDKDDDASAVIEVRAGTGGDEAALFAGDLWRMYQRYAQTRGWQVEVISASDGEMGGYKEVVAELKGARRVRPDEVRKRRPPRAARAGDGGLGPHSHVGGDGRGAARAGRGEHRGQRPGHPHRHVPLAGRRRPARQQDGFGRAHHAPSVGHRGDVLGEVAALQPRAGDGES